MPASPVVLALLFLTAPTEEWLWQSYRAGDLDTLRAVAAELPPESASGLFFRALFLTDGDSAAAIYRRIVVHYPDSYARREALVRLRLYFEAIGRPDSGRHYAALFPVAPPDSLVISNRLDTGRAAEKRPAAAQPLPPTLPPPAAQGPPGTDRGSGVAPSVAPIVYWTVQVGAFLKRQGAETTAQKVARFGTVSFIPLETVKGTLMQVRVGKCGSIQEAGKLKAEIQSQTGLEGAVVKVKE